MLKGENTIFTTVRCPDTDAWLEERRKGIGGSDAAVLVGTSPWTSPAELYLDKIGKPLDNDLDDSGPVAFGNDFENTLLKKFAARHPELHAQRVNALLRNIDRPWAQASLDGQVREGREWGILELKCPGSCAPWKNGVPAHYLAQVYHYMAVTGRRFAYVFAFFRDSCDYGEYRIVADDDAINEIETAVDDFWNDHVAKKIPPTKTFGTDHESKALAALYSNPSADFVHAEGSDDVKALIDEWEAAKQEEDDAKKRKTLLANTLCAMIGDHKGIITNNARLTWIRTTSSTLNKKKLALLYPNAIGECFEDKPRNMGLRIKRF